jgi:predicted phosphodiesterase
MGIFQRWREARKARKARRTRADIQKALTRAYENPRTHTRELEPTQRVIIFSDLHKGARDGADDFQRCERAYNAALAYYNHLEYHLIELGDVEELWENSFEEVASCYPRTLELAAKFHDAGRYTRFWGNHDLAWTDTKLFQERMSPYRYGDVEPIEALKLSVPYDGGARRGELFLVHGHQGTADSDRHARLSQFFVRHVWRGLQRRLNRPWNTPSVDWALRGEHARTMEEWALGNDKVLIAGHTHLPVFYESEKKLAVTPADAAATDGDPEALRLAWAEWDAAEVVRLQHQHPYELKAPCYFNTGCCAFGDGDITGIEIAGGRIALVHWTSDAPTHPNEFAGLPLRDVFEFVR